jgi:predicted MPP superfamily phosphohydrolase
LDPVPVKDRVLDRFVAKVNVLHPDIILIGDDLLQASINPYLTKLKMQFRGLSAKYGVYAIRGNEDIKERKP